MLLNYTFLEVARVGLCDQIIIRVSLSLRTCLGVGKEVVILKIVEVRMQHIRILSLVGFGRIP